MYRKIRITVASLAVIMIAVLSSAGTLSYYTDTDGTTNNFVVGNASSKLTIYGDETGENVFTEPSRPTEDGTEVAFYPQAVNNGNIPVYQRFRVVIPIGLEDVVTLKLPTDESCAIQTTTMCSNDDYTFIYKPYDSGTNTPAEYDIVSKNVLNQNSLTKKWPMTGIKFGAISDIDSSQYTCAGGDSNRCVFGVEVYSDVIQTTGFENGAVEAFESFTETHN